MVPLKIESKGSSNKEGPHSLSGVCAIINIVSPDLKLVMYLHTTEKLACAIFAAMVGEKLSEWSDEVSDAFGELANITAGNFKSSLGVKGLFVSIPSVVRGKNFRITSSKIRIIHEENFLCEGEEFNILVGEEGK